MEDINEEMKIFYLRARYLAMKGSRFLPNSKDHMSVHNKITEEMKKAEEKLKLSVNDISKRKSNHGKNSLNDDYYPTSMVFWPRKKMKKNNNYISQTLKEEERKEFASDKEKDFGCVKHASSCMLQCMIFPAKIPHATIPNLRGWRISIQMQMERTPHAGFFPIETKTEKYTSGIRFKSVDDETNKLF